MNNKYLDYLKSQEWKLKRDEVLVFWKGLCALCYSDKDVQVHHRTYERLGHELLTDLLPLCDPCHERHTAYMRQARMQTIQEVTQIMMAEMAR